MTDIPKPRPGFRLVGYSPKPGKPLELVGWYELIGKPAKMVEPPKHFDCPKRCSRGVASQAAMERPKQGNLL